MFLTINIKTGPFTDSRVEDMSIEALRLLHNKDITVDTELTWVHAIAQAYNGFKIDSTKYYVRRIRLSGGEGLHALHEPISDLLKSEFRTIRKRCCVQIMEFDEFITSADITTKRKRSDVENPPTPQDSEQQRPRRTIKPKNMREEDDFEFEKSTPSPRRKKSRIQKQRYTRKVQNGWRDDMNGETDEELFVEKEQFVGGNQQFYNRVENHRPRPPKSQPFPSQFRQPSQFQQPPHQKQQKVRGEDKTRHKEEFLHRARTVLTNSQLLKARHALQQLKESSYQQGDNKWTKWVLESPGPVNIIRLLFDV